MTAPRPIGFLMHDAWRADAVLARRLELGCGRHAPARARAWVAALLTGHLAAEALDDVEVLVSELVTNAVRHGCADPTDTIVVHLALAPDVVRIEVCDHGPGFEPPAVPRPHATGGGNGLVMLAKLSSSWGVAGDDGTCVWFERTLPPA
jgi:hypothetical protein